MLVYFVHGVSFSFYGEYMFEATMAAFVALVAGCYAIVRRSKPGKYGIVFTGGGLLWLGAMQ